MKKHSSNINILKHVIKTGTVSKQMLEHALSCEECSAKIEAVTGMLSPSDNVGVKPSDFLESRILNSYRSLKSPREQKISSATVFRRYITPFRYAAISAILIFAVYIGFNYYESIKYKTIPLALKLVMGNIQINDKTAGPITLIKSGSIIKTQKDSYADLYYDNIFSIRLAGETIIEIKKCLVNDKDQAYRLEFDVKNGAVYANFFHNVKKEYKLEYAFNTSAAVIKSIGTEFLLQISNENTMLIMREGQVKIKSAESGNETTANQGKKYFIGTDIKINDMDDNDKSYIESILNPGAGTEGASLKKSPPIEKTAVKENARTEKNKPVAAE